MRSPIQPFRRFLGTTSHRVSLISQICRAPSRHPPGRVQRTSRRCLPGPCLGSHGERARWTRRCRRCIAGSVERSFGEALSEPVGPGASGLSPGVIGRLKAEGDGARTLAASGPHGPAVCVCLGGRDLSPGRLQDEKQCVLVLIGVTAEGRRNCRGSRLGAGGASHTVRRRRWSSSWPWPPARPDAASTATKNCPGSSSASSSPTVSRPTKPKPARPPDHDVGGSWQRRRKRAARN